ncbi:unnamed protein product [Scytosiphon promiscuus]
MDDVFGSDSSGNEFDPAEEGANDEGETNGSAKGNSEGGDALEDSDAEGNHSSNDKADEAEEASSRPAPSMGGTGLSDSEDEDDAAFPAAGGEADAEDAAKKQAMDADVFGSDSEDEVGPTATAGSRSANDAEEDVDPFQEKNGKTLGGGRGRLSKGDGGGKGKGKKRKSGADGRPDRRGRRLHRRYREFSLEAYHSSGGLSSPCYSTSLGEKKVFLRCPHLITAEDAIGARGVPCQVLNACVGIARDYRLHCSIEIEIDSWKSTDHRTRFMSKMNNPDDNPDLLIEYNQDAPDPGDNSEAEEDNEPQDSREEDAPKESVMNSVLASMKKRKAQDLSTAEREQIAQEFMFKINQAAEDDEEAVQEGRPALNKLKMLKTVKATLAKKELQETFLEFDLLGVVKRWLQPYSNGQLPNLTIRKEMLALVLMLPVQVDHLKRSGIGKVVMGLLNSKQETIENKRVLRELVSRWNRPVYEKATRTNYGHNRSANDELEAMERDGPSRNEAVGNILNARAKGVDPTKSRVPFSNGYAFSKAPRSKVEGQGRAPAQQVRSSFSRVLLFGTSQ